MEPVLTYENMEPFQNQLQKANISSQLVNLHDYIGTPIKEVQQIINIIKLNQKRKQRCHPQQQSHP